MINGDPLVYHYFVVALRGIILVLSCISEAIISTIQESQIEGGSYYMLKGVFGAACIVNGYHWFQHSYTPTVRRTE